MNRSSRLGLTALFVILCAHFVTSELAQSQATAQSTPNEGNVVAAPVQFNVLVQSPAETSTDLQIICLFESAPQNTLHGSLVEANDKLKGLLANIRKPELFRGELGETLLIEPPAGSLSAKKLLIIGLGDSETFTPKRMELVGSIAYRESSRLGVLDPYFAPTVLDGGVTKYGTGEVAENFVLGFRRAARTEVALHNAGASSRHFVQRLTYLAGAAHSPDTQQGIDRSISDAVDSSR